MIEERSVGNGLKRPLSAVKNQPQIAVSSSMKKLKMASTISAEALAAAISSSTESTGIKLLLLDCRSFMDFDACHIRAAHNVYCPPIVKRRSGGNISLDSVIRCPTLRAQLTEAHFDMVIVYDEDSECLDDVPSDSNTNLVLKALRDRASIMQAYFLGGGLSVFRRHHSHLCTGATILTSGEAHGPSLLPPPPRSAPSGGRTPCHLSWNTPHSFSDYYLRDSSHTQKTDPEQIMPWLFLGSAEHATSSVRLHALGVTALLNVSTTQLPHLDGFVYMNIPVSDNCGSDLAMWFTDAIQFIETARASGGKVLVHCKAGISRSATICLAYLMYHSHYTLDQAFHYLKARRAVIDPNLSFMRQLVEYEGQLGRDSVPEGLIHPDTISEAAPSPKAKRPCLSLPLNSILSQAVTPSSFTKEAVSFVFEPLSSTASSMTPGSSGGKSARSSPLSGSPSAALPGCHSPLLSQVCHSPLLSPS